MKKNTDNLRMLWFDLSQFINILWHGLRNRIGRLVKILCVENKTSSLHRNHKALGGKISKCFTRIILLYY